MVVRYVYNCGPTNLNCLAATINEFQVGIVERCKLKDATGHSSILVIYRGLSSGIDLGVTVLYGRIVNVGTLSEPKGVPDPQFALPSTINWMAALALITSETKLNFASALSFYSSTVKRTFSPHEENTIFEQLVFAVHQLSAIEALRLVPRKADVARVGIVAWYYGIYAAARGMVAAQNGSFQTKHASAANSWDRHLAAGSLVMPPFALRLSTIKQKEAKSEIEALRSGSSADLKTTPVTPSQALGACCSYLSGTAEWYRSKNEKDVRRSREFKELRVSDFRTKKARELRDEQLARKSVSFLHQAVRYRGKANYREALFLGCGSSVETFLASYIDNLAVVLAGFVSMAGAFVSLRLGGQLWEEFINDLERTRAFTLSPRTVWS